MSESVRVLVVDDSLVHRAALERRLKSAGLDVVGTASDGYEALSATLELRPQVVLMDVRMPRLDGLEATHRIMADRPTPILLMSAADNLASDVDMGLRALELGALDLIPKPELLGPAGDQALADLANRLRLLAKVPVISHPQGLRRPSKRIAPAPAARMPGTSYHRRARQIVAIVASTGGPSALRQLLGQLPPKLPAAVVVVQHIDQAFEEGLARWLDEEAELGVVLPGPAPEHDLFAGHVYLAPQGRYAEITQRRKLVLSEEPVPPGKHCPSGDRLLSSLASAYGHKAVGVVLTGMGADGAQGLVSLKQAGALTIAQDEASAVIYGMPRVAKEAGGARRVLPLDEIAQAIMDGLA